MLSLALLVLGLTLTATPTIQAETSPINSPVPVNEVGSISGDVVNIDLVNNTVQVKDSSGIIQSIRSDDRVEIMRRGEIVRLLNLSLGDFVTVRPK